MERWKWEAKQERYQRNQHSFSSALLDAIYKSTDDDVSDAEEFFRYRKKTTTAVTATKNKFINYDECKTRHAARIDKSETSIETKQSAEKLVLLRKASELNNSGRLPQIQTKAAVNDTLVSSEWTRPSCLHAEYAAILAEEKKYNHPPPLVVPPKKHSVSDILPSGKAAEISKGRGVHHLKLYRDFKKAKQPNSPGSRIASFLNSLFATTKKEKLVSSAHLPTSGIVFDHQLPHTPSTTSTTPSSRSCLSKTPSTRGNGATRSVRFCVPGEEREKVTLAPSVGERLTVKDLIEEYRQRKKTTAALLVDLWPENKSDGDGDSDEETDDGDAASYASSDLFELDHLSTVGLKELPVYETTSLATNRAIAKGLLPVIMG